MHSDSINIFTFITVAISLPCRITLYLYSVKGKKLGNRMERLVVISDVRIEYISPLLKYSNPFKSIESFEMNAF